MRERLHTCDHILSTILEQRHGATYIALELKDDICRADYECEEDIRKFKDKLEQEVNEVIAREIDISHYELPWEDAARVVDLSRVPLTDKVEIYEIKGFNRIACAGPHVTNTKWIGRFMIMKIEKKGLFKYSIKFTVS